MQKLQKYLVRFNVDCDDDGFLVRAENPAQAEELVWQDIGKNYDCTDRGSIPMQILGVEEVSGPVYRVLTELKPFAEKEGLRREWVFAVAGPKEAEQRAVAATLRLAHPGWPAVDATVLMTEEVFAATEK
jgi:hypothetical protein